MAIAPICPFLPSSAQQIWDQLGLKGNVADQGWDAISELGVQDGHRIGEHEPIFTKVDANDIAKHKKKFTGHSS